MSLYEEGSGWHCERVNAFRQSRRDAGLAQQEFAELVAVPLNTFRRWDSGWRAIPCDVLERAKVSVRNHATDTDLRRSINSRANSASIRGHYEPPHDEPACRTVFGAVGIRMADSPRNTTRRGCVHDALLQEVIFAVRAQTPPPDTHVPSDYARRLRSLRRKLGFTRARLATRIGAAGKAVIYRWESEERHPSPVFWRAVECLQLAK